MKAIETWEDLLALILERVAHDVSGTATTLAAIPYIAGDRDDEALGRVVAQEQTRLDATLTALRTFPRGRDSATLQDPSALLEPVVEFAQWLRLAPAIELQIDADAPVVRAPEAPLQRTALLALAVAAQPERALRLTASSQAGALVLRVPAEDASPLAVAEVGYWAKRAGATARAGNGAIEVRIAGI